MSIYFASVPLEQHKTVQSVTLPIVANAGGTTAMHIWAMAIGNGTPTTGAPFASLAAAYDNAGISDNSNPAAADFDGTGESFSAQALAAGTPTALTAGGQATIGGVHVHVADAVGAPDNVIADGQIIDLSGSGTSSASSAPPDSARRPGAARSPTPMAAPSRTASRWRTGSTTPR